MVLRLFWSRPPLNLKKNLAHTPHFENHWLKVIHSLVHPFNCTVSVRLFGPHPSAIAVFTPAQKIHTKGGNELEIDSIEPNKTGVNTPIMSVVYVNEHMNMNVYSFSFSMLPTPWSLSLFVSWTSSRAYIKSTDSTSPFLCIPVHRELDYAQCIMGVDVSLPFFAKVYSVLPKN